VLRQTVKDHIGGLNFGYRKQLREKTVTYVNALAVFVDPHTVEYTEMVKKQVCAHAVFFSFHDVFRGCLVCGFR
jgi:thioredoxin reductase (NADPH)